MYVFKTNFTDTFPIDSNAGGELTGYIATNNVNATSEWGSFTSTYHEARVLGMKLVYEPFFNVSSDAAVGLGAVCATHEQTGSNPTGLGQIIEFADHIKVRTTHPFVCEWRARGIEELTFKDLNAWPSVGPGVKWFIDDCAAERVYGRIYITFLVEFRGRR